MSSASVIGAERGRLRVSRIPIAPIVVSALNCQRCAGDRAKARGLTPGSFGLRDAPGAKRVKAIDSMRAEDEIGFQRQDVAAHAFDVVD